MRVLVRGEGAERFGPLDWSPDGKQILIWTETSLTLVSTDDGSLKPVRPRVRSYHARFSPDGRHIVYDLRNGDLAKSKIFLIAEDGSHEIPLVQGAASCSSPLWTPDGRKVVFLSDRSGKPDLWSIRVADGKPQGSPELLTSTDGSVQLMGFSRNGSLYLTSLTDQRDVYVAGLDPATGKVTSERKRISGRFVGGNTGPLRWSPDGRLLAYLRRGAGAPHLVIHTVATGEEREVPGVQPLLVSLAEYLAWFPDSRSLLVMASPAAGEFLFHRVDIETGRSLATFKVPKEMRGKSSSLSRDGKTLFYGRVNARQEPAGKQNREIYDLRLVAHELESGVEEELYRTKSGYPGLFMGLSHDGKQLAFAQAPLDFDPKEENWRLLVIPVGGSEPRDVRRLDKGFRGLDSIAWTPDGRYVLVASLLDSQLWAYPMDGSEPHPCDLKMQGLWNPSVSPDGRRIAFSSGMRQDELWVIKNLPLR